MPDFSIIIPSLGRSESLYDCKESIYKQTYQNYEIITVTEEGPLAKIRNEGARRAKGSYLCFIDDDVISSPGWLEAVKEGFEAGFAGVSGPSFTRGTFRSNRDCFKLPVHLFSSDKPGHLSSWGQWSLEATKENCSYCGEVEYLEACNMCFRADLFREVGGFDESYGGIGDWSEPDLAFRLRQKGYKLWFSKDAKVEHRPSQSGAYKKRLVKCDRMENYERFSARWIKPCWKHSFYKKMVRMYLWTKENRLI